MRKYIINRFHESIPSSRIILTLSIIDEIILKVCDNDIDDILRDIHELRENILYMRSFEKTIEEESESEEEND